MRSHRTPSRNPREREGTGVPGPLEGSEKDLRRPGSTDPRGWAAADHRPSAAHEEADSPVPGTTPSPLTATNSLPPMASVVFSVTSSLSGFSSMEDDVDSCGGFDSSDNGSAILTHQDIVSSNGLDSPSISIDSYGSWNIVRTDVEKQTMYQTPPPPLQLDANASFPPLAETPPFGDAEAQQPMDFSNHQGNACFDLMASLDAQQRNSQDNYVIEAHTQGHAFGNMTEEFLLGGHNVFDYSFHPNMYLYNAPINAMDLQSQSLPPYHMPSSTKFGTDAPPPWNHTSIQASIASACGHFDPPPGSTIEHPAPSSRSSIELSPEMTPGSLQLMRESRTGRADIRTRGTKRKGRDAAAKARRPRKRKSPSPRLSSSDPEPGGEGPAFEFCNMHPDNWGKGGFDGMSALSRSSHKGRKGALSEDTRANALAVRKAGACFCCHLRKVRCDQQRPCKNCLKFCHQVPLDICWQFEDFTKALFPIFIRKHFGKEEMNKFVSDNVQSFTLNGVEQPCTVILSSGPVLMSKLVVRAGFFTAKASNSDVLQHWSQISVGAGADHVKLERISATPIGLEMGSSKSNELRRKVEAYVHNIVQEPAYARELTASMRKSSLPRRMLRIVQRYSQQSSSSNSSIVKRALSIYTMHYILTRHLILTQQSIEELRRINPVRATGSYMTPRLLNRQIKAVVDDLARDGVKALFEEFSRRLKKKSRDEWAPCLAAFLVLCMLMEAMEAATDVFATSENEVGMLKNPPAAFERAYALKTNKRIEDGPFKQFAFQFHQIYQTHSKDASTKSFNPLADDSLDETDGLSCSTTLEMVHCLRDMLRTDRLELQSLTADASAMDPDGQNNTRPRNVSEYYVGRLWSRFLLSFTNSWYILGPSWPDSYEQGGQ